MIDLVTNLVPYNNLEEKKACVNISLKNETPLDYIEKNHPEIYYSKIDGKLSNFLVQCFLFDYRDRPDIEQVFNDVFFKDEVLVNKLLKEDEHETKKDFIEMNNLELYKCFVHQLSNDISFEFDNTKLCLNVMIEQLKAEEKA